MALAPGRRHLRRTLPLLPARLIGFVALASLGVLQWQRMIAGISDLRALSWVVLAAAWALAIRRAKRVGRVALVIAGLFAGYLAAGLDLSLLRLWRLDELGSGLLTGVETLATVPLPYDGADRWPDLTLALVGVLLCVMAALLAFWPRRGRSLGFAGLALVPLLILVVSPIVSIGTPRPTLLGIALLVFIVGFLWLERMPLAPGVGVATMLVLATVGALPLASAADREEPWVDYRGFVERLGPDEPLRFDWGHSYGPMNWTREGAEVFRVDSRRPAYWKVAELDAFDGNAWFDSGGDVIEPDPELDLAPGWRESDRWRQKLRVSLRRLEIEQVIGAGTTLSVQGLGDRVERADKPGLWDAPGGLRSGDSYTAETYIPRPSQSQLARSSGGADAPEKYLRMTVLTPANLGRVPEQIPIEVQFRPYDRGKEQLPSAPDPIRVGLSGPFGGDDRTIAADKLLSRSDYSGTWKLARALMKASETPYGYLTAVDRYLARGFTYDEQPINAPGEQPLEYFMLKSKRGYCQHFSASMALLLRMGGIPARVATGFSPGGYSERKRAWIVRDTDAHSWVEAWFDEYGWVTFDPTPPATPARSLIAALDESSGARGSDSSGGSDSADPGTGRLGDLRSDARQALSEPTASARDGADGGSWRWLVVPIGLGLAAVLGWLVQRWRWQRRSPAARLDWAVRELDRALGRLGPEVLVGSPAAGGGAADAEMAKLATPKPTLAALEQCFTDSPETTAYLGALRDGRFSPQAAVPTRSGRSALRRSLGRGGGVRGRLRALLALPPWRG